MPGPFDRYSLYAANLGGILLRDLFDVSYRTQTKKSVVIPGGDVHPRAVINCCADPMIRCSTKDLVALFTGSPNVGVQSGHKVDVAGAGTASALLQFQSRADGGTFLGSGTSQHIVGTNTKGFLYLSELSARQDDERGAVATLEYAAHSTNGQAEPMAFSPTSALSSSPNFGSLFYMGPVIIGNLGSSEIVLPGVQSFSIRTGIDYRPPRGDGNQFSVNGSIHAVVPEIRIETLDPAGVSTLLASQFGRAFIANAAFNFVFKKGQHGGFRDANGSNVHIIVSATTGEDSTEEISVSGLDDGRAVIVVRPTGGLSIAVNQVVPNI